MSKIPHITVKYSCALCGLHRVECNVPSRPEEMHPERWLEKVCGYTLAADHACRSPHCEAETLAELMIPLDKAKIVGLGSGN